MENGQFIKEINSSELQDISQKILGVHAVTISQVCERYGDEADDVRYYDVYYIKTKDRQVVLKKTDDCEASIYKTYFNSTDFNVPRFYGSLLRNDEYWICMEYIEGTDLRDMTEELAKKAANSLNTIQSSFWMSDINQFAGKKEEQRFIKYWKRILKRAMYVADNPLLREAYQLFLNRQLTCPCTLSNGDLLEWNTIDDGKKVMIIDWGFGGIMPYSLDIARFIAHATEDKCTFPFYMNGNQKGIFLNTIYENLQSKISREQFDRDVNLALLNEYIEFVEADEDEEHWYFANAMRLAQNILSRN